MIPLILSIGTVPLKRELGLWLGEGGSLAGPHDHEIGGILLAGGGTQGAGEALLQGVGQGLGAVLVELGDLAVDDRPRRAAGDGAGNAGLLARRSQEHLAVHGVHVGFRASEEGGADLRARRAERKRCGDAAPVGDAGDGDYRHIHRINHLG